MELTGHLTPSVFERYNITDDRDRRDAVAKLAAAAQDKQVLPLKRRRRGHDHVLRRERRDHARGDREGAGAAPGEDGLAASTGLAQFSWCSEVNQRN